MFRKKARPEKAGEEQGEEKSGWFKRLKSGLSRSSNTISTGIGDIFTKRKLDAASLEELEELLITSDLGVGTAARVSKVLSAQRFEKEVDPQEVRRALAGEIRDILAPVAKPLEISPANKPHVILMVGVNGTGKTTTIGKMARQLKDEGKSVMLAAGDTFRAAAIEQLQIWGERVGVPVVAGKVGSDASGLAWDAMDRAVNEGIDVLLIDTAGRLQNRAELMDELAKVIRVIAKKDATAPHDTILVLDATTGQNALSQTEVFGKLADISGIIMTKLDGSARGGILVACAEKFALPVHAIGVGEAVEDLHAFDPAAFANALVGLDDSEGVEK
jgi:fused signal recognition particle receptor